MLALAFALAPFWFVFGNNCFLTIQPAHIAAGGFLSYTG